MFLKLRVIFAYNITCYIQFGRSDAIIAKIILYLNCARKHSYVRYFDKLSVIYVDELITSKVHLII